LRIVIDRYFESRREALFWAASHPHFMIVRADSPERAGANLSEAD
jgi:hypothetical protein